MGGGTSVNIPADFGTLSASEQQELQQVFEKLKHGGKSEEDALEEVVRLYRSSGANVATEVAIGMPSMGGVPMSFSDFQGFAGVDVNLPVIEGEYKYLNKWDGIYLCMDCWYKLNDTPEAAEKNAARIALEQEKEKNTPVDVIGPGQSVGSMSAARGVKIGWLLAFTKFYNCYNWSSWEIIRWIVKPATEKERCRMTELAGMASFVGPASTFISYAQAGKWGDLIAAIADGGADLDRYVWIDIFAIRQWPSDSPDLDFASTIEHCSSFMVVCSYQKEVDEMDNYEVMNGTASIFDLEMSVKRQICFARVWCLVEAHKACTMDGMPYIMKVGPSRFRRGWFSGIQICSSEHVGSSILQR